MKIIYIFIISIIFTGCSIFFGGWGESKSKNSTNNDLGIFTLDSTKWTIVEPTIDSRIIYISEDGNDQTGEVYSLADVGNDPTLPKIAVKSFATYKEASLWARVSEPDWILFKRGDRFSDHIILKPGRSKVALAYVGSYGEENELPLITPIKSEVINNDGSVTTSFSPALYGDIRKDSKLLEYVVIRGLDFYSITRDHNSTEYEGRDGGSGISMKVSDGVMKDILIEGCKFRYFTNNDIQNMSLENAVVQDFYIRRCSFFNNYSPYYNDTGHSQGLFTSNIHGIVLVENIFDHNGWNFQAGNSPEDMYGPATIFNHNTYFTDAHNVMFKENIFLRSSSIQNKFTANYESDKSTNITLDNNFYGDGEVAISLGGNTLDPLRFRNIKVEGNVITEIGRSRPTNRNLGWGAEIVDWNGGSFRNNYMIHNSNPEVGNVWGINLSSGSRDVIIEKNIIYNINAHRFFIISDINNDIGSNIIIRDNISVENKNSNFGGPVDSNENSNIDHIKIYNNIYEVMNEDSANFRLGSDRLNVEDWNNATGDNSVYSTIKFKDETRSVETYMESIDKGNSFEDFIDRQRAQGYGSWDDDLNAKNLNAWLKAGFQVIK